MIYREPLHEPYKFITLFIYLINLVSSLILFIDISEEGI